MARNQALEWALKNLPQWPESEFNLVNVPLDDWYWMTAGRKFFLVNMNDGEMINRTDFLNERNKQRLAPCGISFKELIDDLFL